MKYQEFDYPHASQLNALLYDMSKRDIELYKPATLSEALINPYVHTMKTHLNGGVLTSLQIHTREIAVVDKFFEWIERLLDIKTLRSWVVMYNKGECGTLHNHLEYDKSFCYYVNLPEGSPPLILQDDIIEPVEGRVIAFSGQLAHEVPVSTVDGRCSLVGHGS